MPDLKTAIEIHNSKASKEDFSTRHKIRPAMVRLRILEANFFAKKLNLDKFILVLNECWRNRKYINELMNAIDKKVIIFFTNFEKGWEKMIGTELVKKLKI